MKRPTAEPPRSQLRVADLKARIPSGTRLMNVKIPSHLANAIDEMAHRLNATKQSVMLALLNEGLAAARVKVRK